MTNVIYSFIGKAANCNTMLPRLQPLGRLRKKLNTTICYQLLPKPTLASSLASSSSPYENNIFSFCSTISEALLLWIKDNIITSNT